MDHYQEVNKFCKKWLTEQKINTKFHFTNFPPIIFWRSITFYRDEEVGGKFLNDLESLLYIKKNIDLKISFNLVIWQKKEKDILKAQDIIR